MTAIAIHEFTPFDCGPGPSYGMFAPPFTGTIAPVGLNLFLHALLTPSGWQHWHALVGGEGATPEPRRTSNK